MRQGFAKVYVLVLVACSSLLMGISSCEKPEELTLFHTNDIHSHLRASKADPFGLGGLARLSTLLQNLRKDAPLSMTLDAGDWSEGTWYYNVNVGANMLELLSALKYDAVCLGNHDFLNGPDGIIQTVNTAEVPFPVLAANLEMSNYPRKDELKKALPPYFVKTVGDLKIGVIGLTTYEPIYTSYLAPVQLLNPIDAATTIARDLKQNQGVNVLILLSHNQFAINKDIALAVPGVDIVISGHQHLKVPVAELVNAAGRMVPVVETGEWAKFLGELKMKVYKKSGAVIFDSYKLHPVTPDIPEDPAVATMVNQQDALLSARYGDINEHIADSEIDMLQSDDMETPLGNLAVQAYRFATEADLAIEEISLTGVSMAKGPLTKQDLHDVVPHIYNSATGKEWSVLVWNAKGKDIQTVFGAFHMISKFLGFHSPLGWLSSDNAQVVWDPSQEGMGSIKSLSIGGAPIQPDQHYRVAVSEGFMKGIKTAADALPFLGIDVSDVTDTGREVWTAIVSYAAWAKTLTKNGLGVGRSVHSVSPDLAIHYYSMAWDGTNLSVEIRNDGMKDSGPGTLTCSSGLPNDLVDYGTDLQKWTSIGSVSVAPVPSGASITAQIPWNQAGLALGYWPVRCQIDTAGDTYPPNNTASRVFKLPL